MCLFAANQDHGVLQSFERKTACGAVQEGIKMGTATDCMGI